MRALGDPIKLMQFRAASRLRAQCEDAGQAIRDAMKRVSSQYQQNALMYLSAR
jgi:hypothetical protein